MHKDRHKGNFCLPKLYSLASIGTLKIQILSTLLILEDKLSIGGQRCVCSRSLTLQKTSSKKKDGQDFATYKVKIVKGREREVIFLSKVVISF